MYLVLNFDQIIQLMYLKWVSFNMEFCVDDFKLLKHNKALATNFRHFHTEPLTIFFKKLDKKLLSCLY